jgi:hypothetical protein
MSEPVKLWDIDGNEVIMYSPETARAAVLAGVLFDVRPTVIELPADSASGTKVTLMFPTAEDKAAYMRRVDALDLDLLPALDGMPGDEQPVAEPKRKPGRPRKAMGGL